MYEASLCPGCQQKRARSMNPDIEGYYEVKRHPCFACAALENARKPDEPKGTKHFIVDTAPPDDELMPWTLDLTAGDDED